MNQIEAAGGADAPENRFAAAALERDKREGMRLAIKARWVALAVIAAMLPLINPNIEVLFYEGLLLLLAINGWAQLKVGRASGRSQVEVALVFLDLILMAAAIAVPNPLADREWPLAMQFRSEGFKYFYLVLAGGVLAYSWRTVTAIGVWTGVVWTATVAIVYLLSTDAPALTAAAQAAFGGETPLAQILDPNSMMFYVRLQEVVVFVLVAGTLALSARRSRNLLLDHAGLERERANLARYFSPNVVEELSQNDDPLKQIRTQDIAVLFVDIVGFTRYASERTPEEVIRTLRAFHGRMEAEVFGHHGTLDKYLGDGLMATFGTPFAGPHDALNALRCARAMIASVAAWNAERAAAGEPPIRASFGLHYGPAVLGDIGGDNRLEFAVIGNTVNVASRVEALTRGLDVELIATEALCDQARREAGGEAETADLARHEPVEIRGLQDRMAVWTLA